MGWEIGTDPESGRDIGYGVPSICDFPKCDAEIHRGLSYVCGDEIYGGDNGCGLFFCSKHLSNRRGGKRVCSRCGNYRRPFDPKPDTPEWINHKLTDESWQQWRDDEPEAVAELRRIASLSV